MVARQASVSTATQCLKKIDSLPVDFDQALFAHYPAMKMGVNSAVDAYIGLLAERIIKTMSAHPCCKDWVITAPPYLALPAAANLLCWKLADALKASLPDGCSLTLLDLHYSSVEYGVSDERDFKLRYEYSNNTVEERIKERSRLKDDIHLHREVLAGKGVLVINDIKVTGTQQQHMTQSFEQVQPAHMEWLYIFEVDTELGIKHPEIEHQINTSRLQTMYEYQQLICADDTRHTARCISRLYSHELDDFKTLVDALGPDKQTQLFALIKAERRFDGEYFAEKTAYLEQHI